MMNYSMHSSVTKLRLSNHLLALETGRHTIPRHTEKSGFVSFDQKWYKMNTFDLMQDPTALMREL